LTSFAEDITAEDSGESFRDCIAELEKDKDMLQHVLNLRVEDYNLVVEGNEKLASECDKLRQWCEGLVAKLSKTRSNAWRRIEDLEARVKSAEACSVDIAAEGEKCLRDIEGDLVWELEKLHGLDVDNVWTIGALCLSALTEEPSTGDYLRWLSEEISCLPNMFSGSNENFATAAIDGALAMARDSSDLNVVRDAAAESGVNILHAGSDVWWAARTVSKK
jgi:hypothetical protein